MRYMDLGAVRASKEKNIISAAKGRKRNFKIVLLFFLIMLSFGVFTVVRRKGFSALLDPVSIVASFVSNTDLKTTDGRTNILILGLDARGKSVDNTTGLTDTLLVISIDVKNKSAVMISLPRDLWVKSPNGAYSKINTVYATSGIEDASEVVEDVLGIPIHYYVVVNFNAFRKVIDILGGIDVDVEKSFDDYFYPIEGMENVMPVEARYRHVHFDAGVTKMDAETALIFSRSRKGDNGEGTDFARAKRQQKVITAIRNKLLSLEVLSSPSKIKELYGTYKDYVRSNVGIGEAQAFYEAGVSTDQTKTKSVVLDDRSQEGDGGLLYEPEDNTLYGGSYALIPRAGNYTQIHAYVSKFLFGE